MQLGSINPILNAYQGSDLLGKWIFLTLLFLSIMTWIIILKKFFLYRQVKSKSRQMLQAFQKRYLNPLALELPQALHPFALLYKTFKESTVELLQKNHSVLNQNQTVALSHSDVDFIQAHLVNAISAQTKEAEKNLFILSTIVSLAPFLGLLGTVWGILLTFNQLQMGATASANATIMGGLAMALGTTVVGLVVAIPALIGYNYFKAAISNFSAEMEDFAQLLLASVELQYRQVDLNQ